MESHDDNLKLTYYAKVRSLSTSIIPEKLSCHFGLLESVTSDWLKIGLPAKLHKNYKVCEYCAAKWNDGNHSVKMLPEIKPSSSIRRILNKIKRNKPVSLLEKKIASRIHFGNWMVITCFLCHRKTKIALVKPSVKKPTVEGDGKRKQKKKSKSKKKIKNAGLIIPEKSQQLSETLVVDDKSPLYIVPKTPLQLQLKNRKMSTPEFISLEFDGHFRPKTENKSFVVNPLALNVLKNANRQKKRISSLQDLLNNKPTTKPQSPSLKDFLKRSL